MSPWKLGNQNRLEKLTSYLHMHVGMFVHRLSVFDGSPDHNSLAGELQRHPGRVNTWQSIVWESKQLEY